MAWTIRPLELSRRTASNGTFEYQESIAAAREIAYRAWLLESPSGRLLVDTGPSAREGVDRGIPVETTLARVHGAPLDVDGVVLTHAHWDHMGNLDEVPGAPVWVQRRELEFCRSDYLEASAVGRYYGDLAPLWRAQRDGRIREADGDVDLADGIRLLWTGGHTPGHQVVVVDTADGPVVLCGDLVPVADNLRHGSAPGVFVDLLQVIDATRRILALAPAALVTGHDPGPLLVDTTGADANPKGSS